MDSMRRSSRMGRWALVISLFLAAPLLPAVSFADGAADAAQLVERARLTIDSFVADPNMGAFRDMLRQAKGVFVAPQVLKGAFVVGVSGGSGVFIARPTGSNQWAQPAFYTIGEVSFGPQIGGEASEVVLLVMTERGVSAFLENSVKLGLDVGIAVGPVGMGASAATANLSADILSFSRSKGLYGGLSLSGAVVATRGDWNHAYYGAAVSPSDILIRRVVRNPQADSLVAEVAREAAARSR